MNINNFTNIDTYKAYLVLTQGFKDVFAYSKYFSSLKEVDNTVFKSFVDTEVKKYYSFNKINDNFKIDNVNVSEIRSIIKGV